MTMWSIISNNCWAEPVYKQFQRAYNTPTIGLWFYADDYISFLQNFRELVGKPLHFLENPRSGRKPYPVGTLSDAVDIQFLHFKSEDEAREKWSRRTARLPASDDDLRIRICDRDGFEERHLPIFDALPFRHKVAFVKRGRFDVARYPWAIEMDSDEPFVTSGVVAYHNAINDGFDVGAWLAGH